MSLGWGDWDQHRNAHQHRGKCPRCEQVISATTSEPILAGSMVGISYLCPHCSVVLGVGPDPQTFADDISNIIKRHIDELLDYPKADLQ